MNNQDLDAIQERYKQIVKYTEPDLPVHIHSKDLALLLAEIDRLKAERDAAVSNLRWVADLSGSPCLCCKYNTGDIVAHPYCGGCGPKDHSKWQWRGLEGQG